MTNMVQVPVAVVAQIQMQTINQAANAIVSGDYEGAEVIPENHKLIIGDMLITLTRNRVLETAKCEHCGKVRLEHELNLESGHRDCGPEVQVQPSDPEDVPKRFKPAQRRVVEPTAEDKKIILASR